MFLLNYVCYFFFLINVFYVVNAFYYYYFVYNLYKLCINIQSFTAHKDFWLTFLLCIERFVKIMGNCKSNAVLVKVRNAVYM